MRDHYDFSAGMRGKYTGRVDTAVVRRLGSPKPAQRPRAANAKNGDRGVNDPGRDIDGEIRHRRGDTLVRKRVGAESLSKLLKKK